MKRAPWVLAVMACLVASGASARERTTLCHSLVSCEDPIRLAERHGADDTRLAITTRDRKVVLLLTDRVVAMQLSDRVLRKVDRKLEDVEDGDDDSVLGFVIKTAVLASVRSVLDHSLECDLRDLASADVRDGELILKARNGQRIFADTEIDDEHVMRAFSESDARSLVRELRRRLPRER